MPDQGRASRFDFRLSALRSCGRATLPDSRDIASMNSHFAKMAAGTLGVVGKAAGSENLESFRRTFRRCSGQRYEIEIPLPAWSLALPDLGDLVGAFKDECRLRLSRPAFGTDIEALNWSLWATTPQPAAPQTPPGPERRRPDLANPAELEAPLAEAAPDHAILSFVDASLDHLRLVNSAIKAL